MSSSTETPSTYGRSIGDIVASPRKRCTAGLAILIVFAIGAGPAAGQDGPSSEAAVPVVQQPEQAEPTPRERWPDLTTFRSLNNYLDPSGWFHVELRHSVVAGSRVRLSFDKYAAAEALLEWRGEGEPLVYADGTLFVAESLDPDGQVVLTRVILVDESAGHHFLLYDADGRALAAFERLGHAPAVVPDGDGEPRNAPVAGVVPGTCRDCHMGAASFQPTLSYPNEPEDLRLELDPRFRDLEITRDLLEGVRRPVPVFGPYGALLLSQISADIRDGRLAPKDEYYAMMLSFRYAERIGLEPPDIGDFEGDDDNGDHDQHEGQDEHDQHAGDGSGH